MISIVREFGHVSVTGKDEGLDHVVVPGSTFNLLEQQLLKWPEGKAPALRLKNYRGNRCIQVLNYVGLIETSDGHQLEVLPKITKEKDSVEQLRQLLRDMLISVFNIKDTNLGAATVGTLPHTWLESLMAMFLHEVNHLVHKGIKKQYFRTSEEALFLKGQLQVGKQLKKLPHQQHRFSIQFDKYSTERPENRLIHLALTMVSKWVTLPKNQRLARELLFYFSDIPISTNPSVDLSLWSNQRDMILYQSLKPWIELVLKNESPIFSAGNYKGLSLLFPMQQLFEDYVTLSLKRQLEKGFKLTSQAKSQYLVKHRGNNWFNLKPDMLITKSLKNIAVLDTKWKLLDGRASDTKTKYRISQNDLYQLYAYGEKYLGGRGNVYLIYPAHTEFNIPLSVFDFSEQLKLWVVPFDLSSRCLVSGEWNNDVEWLQYQKLSDFKLASNN